MFICILSPLCVHISECICVWVCVSSVCVCVCASVGAGQELKRPWDEYVEQM